MINDSSTWASGNTTSAIPDAAHLTALLTTRAALPLYLILFLYILSHIPSFLDRFAATPSPSTSAFVIPALTRHARFLPTPSAHAFKYNTLYLAVRLDALESRRLDTPAFAWKGNLLQPEYVDTAALAGERNVTPVGKAVADGGEGWKAKMRAAERVERRRLEEKRTRNERVRRSLTGLHPRSYLRTNLPGEKGNWVKGSILLKLAYELRERGLMNTGPQDADTTKDWRDELGHVWTVTMPSVAGVTGINPLTVHYCFRPHSFPAKSTQAKGEQDKRGVFWLVVLEVHNTFSERHIYVLRSGVDEDLPRREGYAHQWTFPRSFHVSPFNDRGGFYRLFLRHPLPTSSSSFDLGIRLLLLVESDSTPPKLEKKLMATLDSLPPSKNGRSVRPLSPATLTAALLRQPLDLFLTFIRILWQAGKLHFAKKLDAFGRPDMVQPTEVAGKWDGVGLPPPLNRIQAHRAEGKAAVGGGLVYPEAGWGERVAKDHVRTLLEKRVRETEGWRVKIHSTDPADEGLDVGLGPKELVLYTRSFGVYVDLMTYQPRLALLLGSRVGRRWGVNSVELFNEFFANPASQTGVRKRHLDFLLASADRPDALQTLQKIGIDLVAPKKEGEKEGWKVTTALWMGYAAAVAEKKLFAALGARYVKGTEPWLELQRGLDWIEADEREEEAEKDAKEQDGAMWDTRLGSVYNP
ncbi:Protein of unknown function DUF1365 [Kalmanozyma brasiliensis GHG001]|uniref:Uncharacterized protein n=1 Tax=Kalmanozyma brasiliensis (strain GHG001) TaxID=1365824 RepID=V5GT42_KALBG|nr:Protein of unknown function DUF1365 [Kalmanozyma brasiliensis GHG001]EST09052.1 Protein of unknown function DUF1365 [Kalmanozyma brasiliensis GHG001]